MQRELQAEILSREDCAGRGTTVWLAPEPDAIAVVDSQHGGLIDL